MRLRTHLGDDDIALGPEFEGKTCDRFRFKSNDGFQPKPVTGFYLKVWF